MAMELFILSDRRLASMAEWQRAINAEGFELHLDDSRAFEALRGFLPARLAGKQTGFECDHWDPSDVMDGDPIVDYGHRWKYALAFRWSGTDLAACPAAYMAGAAYARATSGAVLDCEENRILTPQQTAELARKIDAETPAAEAVLRAARERQSRES
jgi:hypothetical protein